MIHKKLTNLEELEILGFRRTEVYTGRFGEIQIYERGSEGILYYVDKDLIAINFTMKPEFKRRMYRRRVRAI